MTKRKIIFGMDVTVSSLALIGVMILMYVILERHHLRYDFTANKRYSLTSQTTNVLKDLKKKVVVTAFFREGSQQKRMVEDLLKEYTYRAKNLEVKFVDPDKDPVTAKRYNVMAYNTTIFESGTQKKDVREDEVFGLSGMQTGGQGLEFKGEQAFTSAILKVTEEKQKNVCFTEGHGERDLDDKEREGYGMMKEMIEKENYQVRKISFLTKGKVPSECSLLVTAGPRTPFFKEEIGVLKNYLEKSGKAVFLLDPSSSENLLPLLLKNYGVRVLRSIVVDQESHFFIDPFSPIPTYEFHDITKELQKNQYPSIFPEAQVVEQTEKPPSDVMVSSLLKTSASSFAETNLTDRKVKFDEKDRKGPLSLGVAVVVRKAGSKEDGRIVVIGDSDFGSNMQGRSKGNLDFFMNSINWAMGEESKISIRPQTPEMRRVELKGSQTKFIFYLTVFIMPLAVFFFGIGIWFRRRAL